MADIFVIIFPYDEAEKPNITSMGSCSYLVPSDL